jgi:hypothetical protein
MLRKAGVLAAIDRQQVGAATIRADALNTAAQIRCEAGSDLFPDRFNAPAAGIRAQLTQLYGAVVCKLTDGEKSDPVPSRPEPSGEDCLRCD